MSLLAHRVAREQRTGFSGLGRGLLGARTLAWRGLYPAVIVLGTLLFFAPALVARRLTLPLDTLGFFYPWNEQATDIFPRGQGLPQNGLIQDVLTLTVPWFEFGWRELHAGRLPLWNPYQLGGMPFIANDESSFFYPLRLVALLLPVSIGIQFELVAGNVLVGLGMYLYLRCIGLARPAACVGGLAFMLSGFFVVWLGYPQAASATWLPWILFCSERVLRTRRRVTMWTAALAVTIAACLLAGHIQVGIQVLLAVALYCIFRLAGRLWLARRDAELARRTVRSAGLLCVGALLGVSLAAVQLLPTAQYLTASYTFAFRNQSPSERPQPVSNLAAWLVPNISGNNAYTRFFPAQQDLNGTYFNFNERTAYVGVPMLGLAVVGLAHPRTMYRHFGLIFFVLAAVAAAVAYGFPPAYRLAVHFPVFHSVNFNRVIFIVAFALVGLGAVGFDAVLRRARAVQPCSKTRLSTRQLAGMGLCAATGLLVLASVMVSTEQITQLINAIGGEPDGSVAGWIRAWTLWGFFLLLLTVTLIGSLLAGKVQPRFGGLALALLILADLLVIADHYAPYNPPAEMYPSVPFTRALQSLGPDALFVVGQDDAQQPAFIANSGTVFGLRDLNVYEAVIALRGHTFMDALNQLGPNRDQPTVLEANYAPDYHLLAVSGVGYVVLPTSDAEPRDTGGHLVFQLESAVSRSEVPLPPLRVADDVTQTFVAPTDDLNAIGVYAAHDTPGGSLSITVRSADGRIVGTQNVSLPSEVSQGSWVTAAFPPQTHSAGQQYSVSAALNPADVGPGSIRLFGDAGSLRPGWAFSRDGQPASGTLRLRLYRSTASDGLRPVWSDTSHTIYQLTNARPEAYVADGVVSVSDATAALQELGSLHVPGMDVVVEGAPGLTSSGGTARVVSSSVPGDIVLEVNAAADGLVVVNQGYADGGWQAEVDGVAEPVLRANYLFQGVQVPAGTHDVHLKYWPISFTVGLIVSGIALLLVAGLFVLPLALQRRTK